MEETKETSAPAIVSVSATESKSKEGLGPGAKVGIGIGVLVGVALFGLVLYLLLKYPGTTQTVRDLFIIALALETFVIGTLLVILVFQVIWLVRLVRQELRPMIDSTQDAINAVKGTTTFVSDRVTKPAIEAMSYSRGVGRAIGVLFDLLPRRGRRPPESK